MKDLEIMNRIEEIDKPIEKLEKLKKERTQIRRNCLHNIVITTNLRGYTLAGLNARCLFCGHIFEDNRELRANCYPIDVGECYYSFKIEVMISEAKSMYREIISQNENLEYKEIAEIIEDKFKDEYYKVEQKRIQDEFFSY